MPPSVKDACSPPGGAVARGHRPPLERVPSGVKDNPGEPLWRRRGQARRTRALAAPVGPDPADPYALGHVSFPARVDAAWRGRRLGLLQGRFLELCTAPCLRSFGQAVEVLRSLGVAATGAWLTALDFVRCGRLRVMLGRGRRRAGRGGRPRGTDDAVCRTTRRKPAGDDRGRTDPVVRCGAAQHCAVQGRRAAPPRRGLPGGHGVPPGWPAL